MERLGDILPKLPQSIDVDGRRAIAWSLLTSELRRADVCCMFVLKTVLELVSEDEAREIIETHNSTQDDLDDCFAVVSPESLQPCYELNGAIVIRERERRRRIAIARQLANEMFVWRQIELEAALRPDVWRPLS